MFAVPSWWRGCNSVIQTGTVLLRGFWMSWSRVEVPVESCTDGATGKSHPSQRKNSSCMNFKLSGKAVAS